MQKLQEEQQRQSCKKTRAGSGEEDIKSISDNSDSEMEENSPQNINEEDIVDFNQQEQFKQYEGKAMLSTQQGTYKPYLVKLFGQEVFFYKEEDLQQHEFMHTLVGTFVLSLVQ